MRTLAWSIIGSLIANIIFFSLLKFAFNVPLWVSALLCLIVFFILFQLSRYYLRDNDGKALFLSQRVFIDIKYDGGLNRVETTSTIVNVGKTFLSKYNHSFRSNGSSLENVEIETSDKQDGLPKPEMINEGSHFKDFYVVFRHALKPCLIPREKYTYTWACSNVPFFFDLSNHLCSWEWTPITKVLKIEFKILHPPGFHVINALAISKNTGEEVGVVKTEKGEYNREVTKLALRNQPRGAYEIRWGYEKDNQSQLPKRKGEI